MDDERAVLSSSGRGADTGVRLGPGEGLMTHDAGPGQYSRVSLRVALGSTKGHWALACILFLGAALRVALWVQDRSLWLDESRLALNISSRTLEELVRPLSFDQVAPLPFLWIEHGLVLLFGVHESVLRLLPLLAGVGLLVLVWLGARKLFGPDVATLATLFCATSPTLVGASAEVKQYTYEALVACALVYSTVSWLQMPASGRRWLCLLAAGIVGAWLTPTAAFVLVGMLLAVAMEPGGRQRLGRLLVSTALWACSAIGAYDVLYSTAANSAYLQRYWSPAFLIPGRPGVLTDAGVALRALVRSPVWRDSFVGPAERLSIALALPIAVCLALVGVIGVRSAARKWGAGAVALLVAPPTAALIASMLGHYPVSGRTTMFILPVGLTVAAAGLWEISSRLLRGWALRMVLAAPVAFFLWSLSDEVLTADRREDVRPLVRRWELERTNGEPLYILAGAIPAWAFYSTDWRAPDRPRLRYLERIGGSTGPAFENASHWPGRVEAQELRFVGSRGVELYGAPTGIEAHAFGLRKSMPDSGWAESEARRIQGAAPSTGVWLLLSHFYGPEGRLLDALQDEGGYVILRDDRNGAALLHYRFR